MNTRDDNACPEGLSEEGRRAYDTIMAVLKKHDATHTGGCKSFYSPAEWKARGEQYGTESHLIVCHDGGDLCWFFNMDYAEANGYKQHEEMVTALGAVGLWFEGCTGWYSAVYAKTINDQA